MKVLEFQLINGCVNLTIQVKLYQNKAIQRKVNVANEYTENTTKHSLRNNKDFIYIGKENKNTNEGHSTLNIEERTKNEKISPLANHDDADVMRRSNPVGGFYKPNDNCATSFHTTNPKNAQNDSTISDNSNQPFSKSDVNFHKNASKNRLRSRRKNSKLKQDCNSTRENDEKSKNSEDIILQKYGSILQSTRDKRKSISRPNEKDALAHYKEKYNRVKKMYEYEKSKNVKLKENIELLTQENAKIKKSISETKQDHFNEIKALMTQVNEAQIKMEYYEQILKKNRSRIDSNIEDICRSNNESKTGESTIESDKLTNILKVKEDHIKHLMQELKQRVIHSNSEKQVPLQETNKTNHSSNTSNNESNVYSKQGKEASSTQRDVVKRTAINGSLRQSKEETPEFCGIRGISVDSMKIKSIGIENSFISEDFPNECRKCTNRGVIILALMRETNAQSENDLLEAVMNMKYDLQVVSKSVKCMRNLQKLLMDCSSSDSFSVKNPPKPKDVWKWVRHLCDEYHKYKNKSKRELISNT